VLAGQARLSAGTAAATAAADPAWGQPQGTSVQVALEVWGEGEFLHASLQLVGKLNCRPKELNSLGGLIFLQDGLMDGLYMYMYMDMYVPICMHM